MNDLGRKPLLLIVDDEPGFRESVALAFEGDYDVVTSGSCHDTRKTLAAVTPDAVLLDLGLPDGNGLDLVRELKSHRPQPLVMVITAHGTVESAVRALKDGAADYVVKPFDLEKMRRELKTRLESGQCPRKEAPRDNELRRIPTIFLTDDKGAMKKVLENIRMVAPLDSPILITGEGDAAKERLAHWVHVLSRARGKLATLDCATWPRETLERELFGCKGGAGPQAAEQGGLFEQASGGTLFLNEIGELPGELQARLLQVLETGSYRRVGDTRERRADFRLVSATSRDLADPAGRFLKELYLHINVLRVRLLGGRKERPAARAADTAPFPGQATTTPGAAETRATGRGDADADSPRDGEQP
jgi:two-component system response regulator PilR (NtrC family)